MEEYNSLKHASHNEEVCNCLLKFGYNDWIITTAFYTALHYMRSKLFPLVFNYKNKQRKTADFDHYCNVVRSCKSKHQIMVQLIEDNCDLRIAATYKHLMDTCMTARYSHYQFEEKITQKAVYRMMEIKRYSTH